MKHYWFKIVSGEYAGEDFLVERETVKEAVEYVQKLFPCEKAKWLGIVSDFEAEMMGIDEY